MSKRGLPKSTWEVPLDAQQPYSQVVAPFFLVNSQLAGGGSSGIRYRAMIVNPDRVTTAYLLHLCLRESGEGFRSSAGACGVSHLRSPPPAAPLRGLCLCGGDPTPSRAVCPQPLAVASCRSCG